MVESSAKLAEGLALRVMLRQSGYLSRESPYTLKKMRVTFIKLYSCISCQWVLEVWFYWRLWIPIRQCYVYIYILLYIYIWIYIIIFAYIHFILNNLPASNHNQRILLHTQQMCNRFYPCLTNCWRMTHWRAKSECIAVSRVCIVEAHFLCELFKKTWKCRTRHYH